MRELYEKLINAYNEHNKGTLGATALNWIAHAENNPFIGGTEAYELFFKAKMALLRWQNNGIDARRNKVRVKEYVAKIIEMETPNPYSIEERESVIETPSSSVVDEKPLSTEAEAENSSDSVAKLNQLEEPAHILGVLPEETHNNENNETIESNQENAPTAGQKNDVKLSTNNTKVVVREIKLPDYERKKPPYFAKKKK